MAWKLFYSYSHKDAELRDKLATYLAPLAQQKKIEEWHDRRIEPGSNWATQISERLDSADMIVLLVSEHFLASEYCFGVEVDRSLERLKHVEVAVVPVLLRPCLWEDSRFSELQMIPRDGKPISLWPSVDEAFVEVAKEIRKIVQGPPPSALASPPPREEVRRFDASLDLVRTQVRALAQLYERTRQRMKASDARTTRMDQIFGQMRSIATASYPLLGELAESPSPGERLAAVSILQVFASESSLTFLVQLVGSEKPFVGYHAAQALAFAVGALEPRAYPALQEALERATDLLTSATPGFDTDRHRVLAEAMNQLKNTMAETALPTPLHD
jgi:hypothetical protein